MKRKWHVFLTLCGVALLCAPAWAQSQQPTQQTQQATVQSGHEIQLIKGVNGGLYESYLPSVVKEVQTALHNQGLYQGEVNGVLDQQTEQAIAKYQKQHGLMVSGVPSPDTRQSLLGEQSQ